MKRYLGENGLARFKEKQNALINTKLLQYSKTAEIETMIQTAIETNITNVLEGDY